jgi:hypothetical protein
MSILLPEGGLGNWILYWERFSQSEHYVRSVLTAKKDGDFKSRTVVEDGTRVAKSWLYG